MILSRGIRLWFFGIFFALLATQCAPLNVQSPSLKERFKGSSPEQILNWAEQENQRNPNELEPYLIRAQAAFDLAKSTPDIAARKSWYIEMRLALDEFNEVRELSGSSASERLFADRDSLISQSWNHEFFQARELITSEQTPTGESSFGVLQMALDHLENAFIIQPDAVESTEWLATLLYESGEAIRALEILEQGRSLQPSEITLSETYLEKLAWLYLETGNLEAAIDVYEELNQGNRSTKRIRIAYINALLLAGERVDGLKLLASLADDFPNDPDIKKVLLLESLRELRTLILSESSEDLRRDDIQSPFEQSQGYVDRISSLVEHSAIWWTPRSNPQNALWNQEVLTDSPTLPNAYLVEVGELFIEILQELNELDRLFPPEFQVATEGLIFSLRNSALLVLERLFENQPDSVEIAEALMELYTELGMKDEADSLQKR